MGILQQCGLLLKKNLLIRKRHPGILLLEVLWPVLIVAIVACIRAGVPPKDRTSCHYQDRAMPSAGLVPFLQTFVCNLDNKCHSEDTRQSAQQNAGSVSSLIQKVTPYLGDEATLTMLDNVDVGVELINNVNSLANDGNIMKQFNNMTKLAHYLRDPDKVKDMLMKDLGFTQAAVDALMDSEANITRVLELTGFPDLKGVACDPHQLSDFLIFPEGTNVTAVSQLLCSINDSKIPELTDFLLNQLDVAELIRLLGLFESVKERLKIPYTLNNGLNDIADMLELLMSSFGDLAVLKEIAQIKALPEIIRKMPAWIETMTTSASSVEPMGDLVKALDPMISRIFPNNSIWMTMKDGMILVSRFTDMFTPTNNNATVNNFMNSTSSFIRELKGSLEGLSPEDKFALDALTEINWVQLWDMISNMERYDEYSVLRALRQLQDAMQKTSMWKDVSQTVSLATDLIHTANVMLEPIIEIGEGVLKQDTGPLKDVTDLLLSKGPNVTLAVLKAFARADTLTMVFSAGPEFPHVCYNIMAAIQSDVGQATAAELNTTLCSADLANFFTNTMQELGVNNISVVLNSTITRLAYLFNGVMLEGPSSLSAMWHEAQTLAFNFQRMTRLSDISWADILNVEYENIMAHSEDWEPVLDMLNENYVGSSVLALMTATARVMNESSSTQWMVAFLAPYVHMAKEMAETMYEQMQLMQDTFSPTSPLGQLMNYTMNYAPQIMSAIMDMGENGNIDMVYKLASSSDPMSTFCDDHMMQKMGLPAEVGVDMEKIICQSNWTEVVIQLTKAQTAYNTMFDTMLKSISSLEDKTVSYSLESDMREISYYTSRIMDMMMSSQRTTGNFMSGPWDLLMTVDFKQMFVAMDMMMKRIANLTEKDMDNFLTVVVLVMENFDRQFSGDAANKSPEDARQWRLIKHYVKIIDDYSMLNQVLEASNISLNSGSLRDVFKIYPDEMKQWILLAPRAYMDFIDALKNIILSPGKLASRLFSGNIQAPNCVSVTVYADFLMLEPNTSFAQLERELCTTNWTAFSLNMMSQIQQISPLIEELANDLGRLMGDLEKLEIDPAVNWTQVKINLMNNYKFMVNQMTQQQLQQLSNIDLWPFNITAINAKWVDFHKDLGGVQNLDVNSLLFAVDQLQELLKREGQAFNNSEMLQFLNTQLFLQMHFNKFMITQLKYLTSKPEVNLMDMFGSDELRKLNQVLNYSPEINQIGVNTLIRIMNDPSKLQIVDLSLLCTNLTVFSEVIAVDDSIIDTGLLQRTLCSLNINSTVLMHQLLQNWDGYAELINAISMLGRPQAMDGSISEMVRLQMEYQEILAKLKAHPPTFTSRRWMNSSLYEEPWMKAWNELEKLYNKFQNPENILAEAQKYLALLGADTSLQPVLVYMDAIISMLQQSFRVIGYPPDSLVGYPNLQLVFSLLEQLPELTEMLLYTAQLHQEQLNNWGAAMTSFETFCKTDPTTLMTAPPSSNLNVVDVFSRLCSIDFEQLNLELNGYQGLTLLMKAINEGTNSTPSVDIEALAAKLNSVVGQATNLSLSQIEEYNHRFLNTSVWEAMLQRLEKYSNQTLQRMMSPEYSLQMLSQFSTMFPEFGGFQGTINQALSAADVILDQMLRSLKGGTMQELFSQYPNAKRMGTLFDQLPQITETLLYSALYTPEKLSLNFQQLTTPQSFCTADISTLLTAPPESGYDLSEWQQTFCAVNITVLLQELAEFQGTNELMKIFQPNSTLSPNLTSISEKMNSIMGHFSKLSSGYGTSSMNSAINITAWTAVMQHLDDWMKNNPPSSMNSPLFYKSMVQGLAQNLVNMPEVNAILGYASAILDMVEQQLKQRIELLPETFTAYPNLHTFMTLLQDVPDIFEMFAYTTLQHPEQLARWTPAMESWETFCGSDPASLVTAPPNSRLTVVNVFQRLCSLNFTVMMIELNRYQGMDKLQAVMAGNMTQPVNVTVLVDRMFGLIDNVTTLFTTPMESLNNIRLFNQTVWDQVFERLGRNINRTQQMYMSPDALLDLYEKFFGTLQLSDSMNQGWAIMEIVLDQMLRSIQVQRGNLTGLFDEYPTVKAAFELLDYLPEIYETAMYTVLFAPDKVVARVNAFSSLETFCMADMGEIFTVPDAVTFDLSAWHAKFCRLNLTLLMNEFAEFQGTKQWENLLQPNSTVKVDIKSVMEKMQTVIGMLEPSPTDYSITSIRYLNTTLWERAMTNLQAWVANPSVFWMRTDLIMAMMQQIPGMNDSMRFLAPSYAVMGMLAEKFLQFENKTTFTVGDLFEGFPEMQKLVQMADQPGVVEVFVFSINSKKFEPLLATNNVTATFFMLCHPASDLAQYLTVPDAVTIDLDLLKTRLCSLDIERLQQEFMTFFDIEYLTAAMNGSVPVDYALVARQLAKMSELITKWAQSPPTFIVPPSWEKTWQRIFDYYGLSSPNTTIDSMLKELKNLMNTLEHQMPESPFKQVVLVAEKVMQMLNENVVALQNFNLTLESMFKQVPILQDVLGALGVEGETLDAMLKAPVKSAQMLMQALLTDGASAQDTVCNMTKLQEILELPDSFDSTALYQAVCLKNTTEAVNNLVKHLDLQNVIDGFEFPSTISTNASQFNKQLEAFLMNLDDLMKHPPTFDAERVLAKLEKSFNTSDMWQIASMVNYNQMFGMLSMFPDVKTAEGVMRSVGIVMELLNNLASRLVVDGVTVDLASLFSSSPSFVKLMDAAMQTQPDLITVLATFQLKPSKMYEIMELSPEKLLTKFCTQSELEEYVLIPAGTNVSQITDFFCTLNVTQFAEELNENFMVDALTKKFQAAMTGNEPLDIQKYVATSLKLVEHITNLTGVTNVVFHGNDLVNLLDINLTSLAEAMESVYAQLQTDIPSFAAETLNFTMAALGNNPDAKTIALALKIVEIYLHSMNKALVDISSGPISLASIMNNTEVGKIVIPILEDPDSLEEMLNLELEPDKIRYLLASPGNLTAALCGPELFTVFAAPGNNSAALRKLQTRMCSVNTTVMMWQAIMGQANGYQLFQQIEMLSKELTMANRANVTAISNDVQSLISILTKIAEEYQSGNRSTDDLLDWRKFQEIFRRFDSTLVGRLTNVSQEWGAHLAAAWVGIYDVDGLSIAARTINTYNLFMNIINDRLEDMINNGVSLPTLLNHSDALVKLIEAYLDVTFLTPQAWLDSQFNITRVVEVTVNLTLLKEKCTVGTLATYLADSHPVTALTTSMQTVLCSIDNLEAIYNPAFNTKAIEDQLNDIWNMSKPVTPQTQQYVDNAVKFNALMTRLITLPTSVSSKLSGRFNMTGLFNAMEDILTNPKMIFSLMKALTIGMDGPLSTNDNQNIFYGISTYIAQPLQALLEGMDNAGLTLNAIANDPSKLIEALPVLMNFDLHFDLIAPIYLQPTLNKIWNYEDFRTKVFCNGSLPDDVFTSMGLQPSIVNTLCSTPVSQWIQTLKGLNATDAQIVAWVEKVEDNYKLYGKTYCIDPFVYPPVPMSQRPATCRRYNQDFFDNKGMYWLRLMTTLESVASHFTFNNGDKAIDVGSSLGRIWAIMQNTFLNQTLGSAMNYMELIDRMGEKSDTWYVFKQFMKFLQVAGDLLNSGLQKMKDPSGIVYLQNLLPDSQKVADLLTKILGPSSAAELLAASVNPEFFYLSAHLDEFKQGICDPAKFSTLFVFPSGSNVTAVQVKLCEAVTTRSNSMQELIDLLQAGDMLVQLDRLINGDYQAVAADTGLWQALQQTVTGMLNTLEQLANGQFNATVSMSWLTPITQAMNALNQRSPQELGEMCRHYVAMVGNTAEFQPFRQTLDLVIKLLDVVSKAMPYITKLDEIMCVMATPDGLDLAALAKYLKDHGIADLLHSIALLTNGTSREIQCSQIISAGNSLVTWTTNLTQPGQEVMNIHQIAQCTEQVSPHFAEILQGFSQLYKVMTDLTTLLADDDMRILLTNTEELQRMLEFVMSIMSKEREVILQFADLLKNSSSVEEKLIAVLKVAPHAVETLLSSTIDFNATTFLSKTVGEIADILCHPELLDEVITLPPGSILTLSDISSFFCTPEVNVTAALLKDAGKSNEIIKELTGYVAGTPTVKFFSNFTTGIINLLTELQSVSVIMDLFDGNFDIKFLMENADAIDAVLAGGGTIQKIVDSLASIVGTLRYVVPPEHHNYIEDIQTVIRGLLGLDLVQSRLVGIIQVSDLQSDAVAVRQYLITELGFTPQAATALLSSTYSIRVFLNASGLLMSEVPCEKRLHEFILMNTTMALEQEITTRFCGMNSTELTHFMEELVPQLDVGDLIQKYVTYSAEAFLETMNLTKPEVEIVFKSLSDGGQSLQEASDILIKDNSTLGPLLSYTNVEGDFQAMVSLQPALCGIAQAPVEDQFNLNSKVSKGSSTQKDAPLTPEERDEEAQMKGQFCKDIYHMVRKTELGAVIWSYLKPIISGKIVYTPDTPLTRRIVAKANWVFDSLAEVKRISKKWSEKMPSLVSLTKTASNMGGLKETLNSGLVKGFLKSSLGVESDRVLSGLDALQNNNFNSSNLDSLQVLAELIYNYTSCVELSRFEGVATEKDLVNTAFALNINNNFLGGIVFMNVDDDSSSGGRRKRQADSGSIPKHIQYKIRMDMDNVATTNRIKDRLWTPFADDDFATDLRYMRGFIQLQDLVESAIISLQAEDGYNDTGITMQQIPFPCHKKDYYLHYLGSYLLPVLMTFAWLSAVGIATYNLVYDRQNGQEESLRIMGMKSGLNVFAWFLVTMVIMAFVSLIITLIFRYADIFIHSNMLIIFLYLLEFCFSTIMLCYFISAFFSRATLAILSVLIIYFITFLPYIILISMEVEMTAWQKILASLSSTTAFSYGAIFITRFEQETVGQQWDNMHDKASDSITFAWMCYMMLIDSAIYLFLGWYIRNVKPGKFGVKQPWYFPVLPSYWCSGNASTTHTLPPPREASKDGYFEAAPTNLDVGISVRGLRKTFSGSEEVVHGIDVDIFRDQITTLLGHNGAAKTTTMSMVVGVLNPSSGTVLVEGKKPHSRTGLMGICPQYNILFEYMTVQEHMEFYGGVKGRLSATDKAREIRKLLHDVDLYHMKDVPAKKLSGGMQRRLCVALAFVGGSTTVVLDEPTSGVDPHARKNIWNLIMKNRPGRTILMSTHHLDEADTLSDRIVMMHNGRMLSTGSPGFFKDQLGGGYKLTVHTAPVAAIANETESSSETASSSGSATPENMTMEHSKVLGFIQTNIPSAKFVESVGSDLIVNLPKGEDSSMLLYKFFCQLDGRLNELGVLSYGISNTTLEEVFLKLTCESSDQGSPHRKHTSYSTASSETESTTDGGTILSKPTAESSRPKQSVKGASLTFQQLGALLVKRVHHYRRNWRMIVSTVVLPLIAFCCALGFATIEPQQKDMQNLLMTPALYSQDFTDSYAFFQDNSHTHTSEHFKNMLMADNPGIGTTCMAGFDAGDFKCVSPGHMHASDKMEQSCHCDNFAYKCTSESQTEGVMQKMTRPNIIMQDMGFKDIDQYLLNSYVNYIDQRFGGLTIEPPSVSGNISTPRAKVWFNNKGYHAIPAYYNALSNNLLRSHVNSTDAHEYGISLYSHPVMLNRRQLSKSSLESGAKDVGIAMVVLLALSFIPSAFMVYLVNEILSQEKHMQSISGVGTLLYWIASFFWDLLVYCFVLGIMVVLIVIFRTGGFYENENLGAFALLIFLFGWAVLPLMYCTLRLFWSGSTAYLTLFCLNMILGLVTTIVLFIIGLVNNSEEIEKTIEVLEYVFLIFPQYCLGMGLVNLITNQVQQDILQRFGIDSYVSPYDEEMLLWKYVALAVEGLIFFILACIIHSRKERALSMSSKMHYNASKDDEDVFNEQERVCSKDNQDALAVRELCKVYSRGRRNFPAVNHLSFGVGRGECFGLLGVNGAGKTTTFGMLTGATAPSDGDAVIHGKRLRNLRSNMGNEIGYCPQQDALDMYLTGKETLRFHAKLRGFASKDIDSVIQEQIKRLQLEAYADKPVHTYSGGNKRKLQLAIAMLGDPSLLLLDEPTTGMDVATRRLAWKCITMATQRGQSVLLTSHSMDECDSLCHRLAIMVNGQLKCIGSPQHLKNKFGNGYTVLLHLQGLSNNHYAVAEAFLSQFPGASIKVSLKMKDQHHSIAEVSIPRGAGRVADIFAAVREAQTQHQIMYYQVSQTTLDSVFVSFACEQTDEGETDAETDTSSGSSSRGSVGNKDTFQKSLTGGTYAYMNPEYAGDPMESFNDSQPPPAATAQPAKDAMVFENKAFVDSLLSTKL